MRIAIIGENHDYEWMIQNTKIGKKCYVEFLDYQDALEQIFADSIVFVEADVENPVGFGVGRTILQRFPGTVLIFLMKECAFEYSMAAMRMGAKNILVGPEINKAAIEQLLCQYQVLEPEENRAMTQRNFERLLLLRGEDEETSWNIQALNKSFGMEGHKKQFYVMIVTSLDFVFHQMKSDTLEKKVYSERIKEHILKIRDDYLTVPFVFYIDQLFYVVVMCNREAHLESAREQTEQVQYRIYQAVRMVLGDQQIVLSSDGKTDFKMFQGCLDELEQLERVMHLGAYPSMLNRYNTGREPSVSADMDEVMNKAHQAVTAIAESGEYERQIRELFSSRNMEQLTFSQFMKLKKRIAFELESLCKKLGAEPQEWLQLEEELDRLQAISNYSYARKLTITIAGQLTECMKKRYNPLVVHCIRLVSQQYASDISLQEMADRLNVSNVYLSALFRRETGKKFSTYVNEYRLDKAKSLMDEGKYPLSSIYEMVGFSNQQYFGACFKKTYGMTPGEYKNHGKKL